MKYKVDDRVRIKSLDWYNENKDKNGNIRYKIDTSAYPIFFTKYMSRFCGEILHIKCVHKGSYYMNETGSCEFWTDEMIEGLVEEETPKFKIGDKITNGKDKLLILNIVYDKYIVEDNFGECGTLYLNAQDGWKLVKEETKFGTALNPIEPKSNANCITRERVDELATKIDKELPSGNQNVWELPDDYQFVDENGNVINATKIFLEKKKPKYPKTYEECAKIMNCPIAGPSGWLFNFDANNKDPYYRKIDILMGKFTRLLICRDAYWKIAGEEMGLGKPWEPDWLDDDTKKYIITSSKEFETFGGLGYINYILTFPTEEMRDAFYENFKEFIEECKELL